MVDLSFIPELEKTLTRLCTKEECTLMDIYKHVVVETIINKLGFDKIGSGCYSTVWQHPTDDTLVIRVFKPDDGWANYADYCVNNPDNPFCPDIYHLETNDGFGIAVIERMRITTDDSRHQKYKNMQRILFRTGGDELIEQLSQYLSKKNLKYIKHMSDHVYMNDVHEDNCMIAFDGRFVITDPDSTEEYGTTRYYNRNYMNALNSIAEKRKAA